MADKKYLYGAEVNLLTVHSWHRADPQEDPDMPLHLRVKTKGLDCLPPHKPSLFDRETWH